MNKIEAVERTTLNVAIVIPIFNDWTSFLVLCKNINLLTPAWAARITILAVDDGSNKRITGEELPEKFSNIEQIEIISLFCNIGHQRAIAVGLAVAAENSTFDVVIVADGDGEDRPEDIGRMINAFRQDGKSLIVARRTKRSETYVFRIFYQIYKGVFRLFTGQTADFGNFCLIPSTMLRSLLFMPEAWNHLAATMLRSRMPLMRLDCFRGERYAGHSSMNLVALFAHGMSAVSVFSDILFIRLLALSAGAALLALFVGLAAVLIRLTTSLAIPGWATTVVGISVIALMQSLVLSLIASCWLLGNRSAVAFIPGMDAMKFVSKRTTLGALGE
jgi:polyisoprenyl-phosphate glycosyltransferase